MLDKKVRKLHELRQERQENDKALAAARREWENENAVLLDNGRLISHGIEALERSIKAARVEMFDGEDKSESFGVGIREKTVLYYIEQDAYNWALRHKLCLKLDTKPFEKLAKDGGMDFVTVEKQPQATIATDLSKWLDEDDDVKTI